MLTSYIYSIKNCCIISVYYCMNIEKLCFQAFHLSYLPPCLRTREDPFNDPLAILLKSKLPNAFVAAAIVFGKSDILKQVTFLVECDYLITDVLLESHYLTPEQRSQVNKLVSIYLKYTLLNFIYLITLLY